MAPTVGRKAPDFELPIDSGDRFQLSAHRGRPVVLFFYPEDDTEGCTIENIEFTDQMDGFRSLGCVVVGISPDSVDRHCTFRDKYDLGIALASDPDHRVIDKYGAWGPKKLFGRAYDGVIRTTVLVGPDGRVAARWVVRRIRGHAEAVLAEARRLFDIAWSAKRPGRRAFRVC